jgi:hypothetical protein
MGENSIMKKTITKPYWANDSKTQVNCQFEYENGRILNVTVSDTDEGNPDWKQIMETIGTAQIDKNTEELHAQAAERNVQRAQREKERLEKEKGDRLFAAKLEAFEIEEVKASKDRKMKSKIRKAKSIMEVQAYTVTLIMKEMGIGEGE